MSTQLISRTIIGIVSVGAVAFMGVYSPPVARADLPDNCDSRPWLWSSILTSVVREF